MRSVPWSAVRITADASIFDFAALAARLLRSLRCVEAGRHAVRSRVVVWVCIRNHPIDLTPGS
jgi:hypothetical protein